MGPSDLTMEETQDGRNETGGGLGGGTGVEG